MQLKKRIVHNLALKCIALILAVLLWSYVYYVFGIRIVKNIVLPIQMVNVSDQYLVTADHLFLEVLFSAPANLIDEAEKNIRATIDLSGYSSGSYKRNPDLSFPRGVLIESISPAVIEVMIENIVSKEITIRPQIIGELEKGNVMGHIELVPSYVVVRGAESMVQDITDARVIIDISNANADLFSSVEVVFTNAENEPINNVEVNQRIIRVHVPIISSNIAKIVPIVPRFKGTPLYRIRSVEMLPPLVTLRGQGSVLEHITSIMTQIIDIDGLKNSSRIPVRLQEINEVIIEGSETYEIIIELEEDIELVIEQSKIRIVQLSSSLEANILEGSPVQIRLFGAKTFVEQFKFTELFVDASGLNVGTHWVELQIRDLPDSIIAHIFPKKIRIEVIEKKA